MIITKADTNKHIYEGIINWRNNLEMLDRVDNWFAEMNPELEPERRHIIDNIKHRLDVCPEVPDGEYYFHDENGKPVFTLSPELNGYLERYITEGIIAVCSIMQQQEQNSF
jgi:hypothetical protein